MSKVTPNMYCGVGAAALDSVPVKTLVAAARNSAPEFVNMADAPSNTSAPVWTEPDVCCSRQAAANEPDSVSVDVAVFTLNVAPGDIAIWPVDKETVGAVVGRCSRSVNKWRAGRLECGDAIRHEIRNQERGAIGTVDADDDLRQLMRDQPGHG